MVKAIEYSLYELSPQEPLNALVKNKPTSRSGALLKVHFEHGLVGYADCSPLPQMGDAPLQEQLSLLSKNLFTPLTIQSITLARVDAKYRSKNMSAFTGLEIPESHYLVTKLSDDFLSTLVNIHEQSFQAVKIKVGYHLAEETSLVKKALEKIQRLNLKLKLRLDFNFSHPYESVKHFLNELRGFEQHIDFIEDPFPYEEHAWKKLGQETQIKFAQDQKKNLLNFGFSTSNADITPSFSGLVIKPAIENVEDYVAFINKQNLFVVFTSYMDHPLGQLGAVYLAAQFYELFPQKKMICGFLTHKVFKKNEFSEAFLNDSPYLIGTNFLSASGAGFGFQEQLDKQTWKQISEY
ncbi:MAG: hypothetical protein K2X39_00380 [Silvanigrellaceae bacterium]|nr:hypothetical protein [Silvanigrellaceae bacterium]